MNRQVMICIATQNVFKKRAKSLIDPRYAGIKKYEGYGILVPVP
jgi:hypothetical protein